MLCLMLCSADCSRTVLGVRRQHQHFPINAAALVTRPLAVGGDTRETEETGASEDATNVCMAGFSTTDAQPAPWDGNPGVPRLDTGGAEGAQEWGPTPNGCPTPTGVTEHPLPPPSQRRTRVGQHSTSSTRALKPSVGQACDLLMSLNQNQSAARSFDL